MVLPSLYANYFLEEDASIVCFCVIARLDGDLRNLIIVVPLAIGALSSSGSRQRKSERQEYQLHGRGYRKNKTFDPA
jgi:hypothetical protein